jgi:hypothetical protein
MVVTASLVPSIGHSRSLQRRRRLLLLLLLLSLSLVLLLIQPLHGHPTGNMDQTLMHVKQVKNGLRI